MSLQCVEAKRFRGFDNMANQHFFKPLLPGFHSHLTIPVAFFSKYIKGRSEQKTTAKLRSDASKITWQVKIEDGQKLTDGWKEFALAHDLQIGDIVIFRQEKDMSFHVTPFGPSFCEIQYESCLDDENNLKKILKKKKVKKNPRKETVSSSLDPSCFVANVLPSTLRYDTLYLPRSFVRVNGLDTRCGEIVLMNEKGRSWTLDLRQKKSCGTMYITRGWRSFCRTNGLKAGDSITFKLIQGGKTLVLSLFTTKSKEEEEENSEGDEVEYLSTEPESDDEERNQDEKSVKKCRPRWKASSTPSRNRFVTLTLKPFNLKKYILFLPTRFTRMHGINEETKMSLLDKHGVKWSTDLRSENSSDRIRMVTGWKEFFKANCVKIGESIMLKLIWEGDTSCVLKFCSKCVEAERLVIFDNMANQHFFKPLLPGFHSHLTIPEAFFLKHMDRKCEKKMVKLRSDASKIIWEVKIEDGQKLTDGWKEFALAHDLQICDIVIFRQEKDMSFHVTLFGPSCCEIQYESFLDNKNKLQKVPKKKNPKSQANSSSLDPSCFQAYVSPSTLRYDSKNLPIGFVRANGLETRCGEIVLMNEKGTSWTLALKRKQCGTTYIRRGWRTFCRANGLRAGSFCTFKLIKTGRTLVLRKMSPSHTESKEEECSEADEIESLSTDSESDEEERKQDDDKSFKKPRPRWKASSSQSRNRFVTLTLTPYNVKKSVLFLPAPFTGMHGITAETKMSLLDKNGVKWSTRLRSEGKRIALAGGGWKDFFKANCVKIGEPVMLKLIWEEDTSCVFKFWSKLKKT